MKTNLRNSTWLLLAAAALSLFPAAALGADAVVAFVGARIIDGTGKPAIDKATIVVRNGRIEAVGASVKVPAGPNELW